MRFKSLSFWSVIALSAVAAVPAAAQEGPPAPKKMKAVSFPEYHESTLSNGARVVVVEDHEQPIVTIDLRIKSGAAYDPSGREGLAQATASMLNKGTATRDATEIAETIDFIGASLGLGAGEEWTSATATVLTEFLDTALEVMADVVIHPTFPDEEIEIERKRILTGLQVELSDPGAVSTRRFIRGIYGGHPYGNLPTVASIEAIERSDMVEFHRAYYRPDNSLFVVAGDVDSADIRRRLDRHFADWKPAAVEPVAMADPPRREDRIIRFYHKPGSVQAVIRMGHLMEPATDSDWPALDVAIRILGGGSQGWLYQTLREGKGYTYGAYASSAKRRDLGYFQAWAEVRNEVTDSSLAEIFSLLDRIRDEQVPAGDLELAVDFIVGSFPRQIETPQQVAGRVATSQIRGLPRNYLERYRTRVAAVDAAEVQRVAREHLQPDRALVVVVGDATEIYDKVSAFGSVELYDVEGNPITRADLEVKASDIVFDPSVIEPTTLVYTLSFQGNPVGEISNEVTRESMGGREVIRSHITGGGAMFTLEQEIVFDAETFAGIKNSTRQQMGGNSVTVDLVADGGRITGSFTGMDGQTKEVDAEVVDGTLLPGMDDFAIWLAPLGRSDEIKLPAFNVQSGNVYRLTVKVVGVTTVTVAAGEFEAYELEVSGGQGRAKIFARKAAPHYVLKQESAGQPVVVELKEIR